MWELGEEGCCGKEGEGLVTEGGTAGSCPLHVSCGQKGRAAAPQAHREPQEDQHLQGPVAGEEESGACVDGNPCHSTFPARNDPRVSVCAAGGFIWYNPRSTPLPMQLRSRQAGKRCTGSVTSALLYRCPWP